MVMQSIAVGHIEPHVCENPGLDQSISTMEISKGIARKRWVEYIGGLR
jgi:hypothetical protein